LINTFELVTQAMGDFEVTSTAATPGRLAFWATVKRGPWRHLTQGLITLDQAGVVVVSVQLDAGAGEYSAGAPGTQSEPLDLEGRVRVALMLAIHSAGKEERQ